ncbi:MAG: hybrid sensor histidine kinase/response regulator [Magnetococcales bacterium]|nr:hybrid sensor histidine kinase/response regulator [Magnetococcales bacterium]
MADGAKAVILIVDDEKFNLNLLKNLLEEEYEILVARNGQQALQRAVCDTPPDLILLDIMMPEMDGYQVLETLQRDEATQSIPVIFVTAMGEVADESRGLALGAVDYITKPISPPILLARVRTHLALRQAMEQQKQFNRNLSAVNEELRQLNQLKNIFLGMAAHDLRNPLVTIRGMSELLLEEELEQETQREFCTTIHGVSEHMLTLLSDLLDISAIESGRYAVNLKENALEDLLQQGITQWTPSAEAKGIPLIWNPQPPLPALLFDRDKMGQVVDNLLSNAIKYSPPGRQVTVGVFKEEERVGFIVEDQGPGLSPEDRENLFKPFQRLSAQPTGDEKSNGMGLYIVKKIVDAHHGSITVEDNPGGGCGFIVTLPIEDVKVQP